MSTGFGPKGYWDQRFASTGFVYGEQPNDFLKEHASGLQAGQALCLAEGEGRNAVFLAELGHQVCAQDISPVGLGKAEELAQRRSVNIHTLCCDLAAFHPEPASLDLIAAIWMHLEHELRATVLQRAVEALRPEHVVTEEQCQVEDHPDHGGGDGRQRCGELKFVVSRLHQRAACENEKEGR